MFKIDNNKEIKIPKTIKLSPTLIKKIEEEAKKSNISFSKFVREACKYALDNIDKEI